MVRVKICGITNLDDALMAVSAGADALGFIFHPPSPRYVTVEQARAIIRAVPPFVQAVGLFVDREADEVNSTAEACGIDIVQLHGDETPEFCSLIRRRVIKAFRVKDAGILDSLDAYDTAGHLLDAWSADSHGGTGETFNWEIARSAAAARPIILAGGLNPQNVAEAVKQVRPFAVDVSSGVEESPGKKDKAKVRSLIANAKSWSW